MGSAAAEEPRKQGREMAVHPLERRRQPLPAFLVEGGDAAAQPRDRLGQLSALTLQTGYTRFALGGLALRHQIDSADGVALTDQPVEPSRHLASVRRRFARGETGECGQCLGHRIDPLTDLALELCQGLVRAVAQYF